MPDAAAGWQAVNDGVMGGVSDGRFRVTERQTLEFYGTLSLKEQRRLRLGAVPALDTRVADWRHACGTGAWRRA